MDRVGALVSLLVDLSHGSIDPACVNAAVLVPQQREQHSELVESLGEELHLPVEIDQVPVDRPDESAVLGVSLRRVRIRLGELLEDTFAELGRARVVVETVQPPRSRDGLLQEAVGEARSQGVIGQVLRYAGRHGVEIEFTREHLVQHLVVLLEACFAAAFVEKPAGGFAAPLDLGPADPSTQRDKSLRFKFSQPLFEFEPGGVDVYGFVFRGILTEAAELGLGDSQGLGRYGNTAGADEQFK